jgi:hypothetical protein
MSSDVPPLLKPRRSYGRWILLGLTLMVTPVVVVAVGVLSMFRLNGDATALRREVVAATDADWNTKVQVSAGGIVLTAVRTGLLFVDDEHIDDARLALAAVKNASVGVYERSGHGHKWSREQLLVRTDERMQKRGMTRVVGVTGHNEFVLVYVSEDADGGDRMDLCVAVVDDDDLVIVSSTVDAGALMKLAERHMPEGGIRKQLKMAGL